MINDMTEELCPLAVIPRLGYTEFMNIFWSCPILVVKLDIRRS